MLSKRQNNSKREIFVFCLFYVAAAVQQPQSSTGTDFANFESFGSLNQAASTNNSNDLLSVSFFLFELT